jgi:hypothetical protein
MFETDWTDLQIITNLDGHIRLQLLLDIPAYLVQIMDIISECEPLLDMST